MALTIQYCSDLHLEFDRNRKWLNRYPLKVAGDILLLGGDVMPLLQMDDHADFLDFVSQHFTAVYWIPGNHEYYHGDMAARSGTLHEAVRHNVFLVNNTTIAIGDTDLVCSTLWSHISPENEWQITRSMSDFHVIMHGGSKLTVQQYNSLHEEACKYILHSVANSAARHKVVLTHHVPTFMNYPAQYAGSPLNQAFATELQDYIAGSGIHSWLYGHTHGNTPDFMIGATRLLTNQLGYVQYGENKHFDAGKTFTVN